MRPSVLIKRVSQNFYPGDPRSRQFRDFSIYKPMEGNMKMLPVSHRLVEATQFFQDHDYSPTCDNPVATDDRGSQEGHLRSQSVFRQ